MLKRVWLTRQACSVADTGAASFTSTRVVASFVAEITSLIQHVACICFGTCLLLSWLASSAGPACFIVVFLVGVMHEPLLDLAEYCAADQAVIAFHVCLLSPCVPGPQQCCALRCQKKGFQLCTPLYPCTLVSCGVRFCRFSCNVTKKT
jgi:hypothetical protein